MRRYAKEPFCLKCGYDLRGFAGRGGGDCPECGHDCRTEALAEELASGPWKKTPVLTEACYGVLVLGVLPELMAVLWFACVVGLGWIQHANAPSELPTRWMILGPALALASIGVVLWSLTILPILRIMGWAGARVWFLAHVFAGCFGLAAALLLPVPILIVMWLPEWWDPQRSASQTSATDLFGFTLTSAAPWLALVAGLAVLYGTDRARHHLVGRPCRARCRELATELLAKDGGDQDRAAASDLDASSSACDT